MTDSGTSNDDVDLVHVLELHHRFLGPEVLPCSTKRRAITPRKGARSVESLRSTFASPRRLSSTRTWAAWASMSSGRATLLLLEDLEGAL